MSWGYQALDSGRLDYVSVTPPPGAPLAAAREVTYDYLVRPDPEAVDRLVNVSDGTDFASYQYDDAGNVIERSESGGVWSFTYDGENQQNDRLASQV